MEGKVDQDEVIRNRLERMVALQQELEQPRDELNNLRREARAEGLHVQALNLLVPLLSQYPHDKAAGVLNEINRYAEIFGAEIIASGARAGSHSSPQPSLRAEAEKPAKAEARAPAASDKHAEALGPLRLSTQVIAAVGLTIALIWLLN